MIVPAQHMAIYRARLAQVSKKAADEIQKYMLDHGFDITEEFLDYADAVVSKYGEAAGALSAEFYDDIAQYWTDVENRSRVRTIKAAEAAEVPTEAEIRKTVYGTLKESAEKIPGALSRLVKRTAEDTTLHNAIRDGAEFAWVPAGDTCAFCIMLASRGWQRASKKALKGGHAEHIHANCDCTYTIRFDRKSGVAGYDPDRYLKMYENTDGGTWQQRLNDMRREQYAADPEKYRAQKRAAYERRTEKRLQENGKRVSINASKNEGDALQPKELRGDYNDYNPLDISEEKKNDLRELRKLALETDEEQGLAIYQGGKTDIQTNHDHNNVTIRFPKSTEHVEIYHSHTDDSVLSTRDIKETVLKKNVDRDCVISKNGDIWVIDYTGGIRPDTKELDNAIDMCWRRAMQDLKDDPAFPEWTYEERYYMLGRETMLRLARLFEWNIMGGNIDGH